MENPIKSSLKLWEEYFSSLSETDRRSAGNYMLGACIVGMPQIETRKHIDFVDSLLKGGE